MYFPTPIWAKTIFSSSERAKATKIGKQKIFRDEIEQSNCFCELESGQPKTASVKSRLQAEKGKESLN